MATIKEYESIDHIRLGLAVNNSVYFKAGKYVFQ